mgnify:CR=1 FL=1
MWRYNHFLPLIWFILILLWYIAYQYHWILIHEYIEWGRNKNEEKKGCWNNIYLVYGIIIILSGKWQKIEKYTSIQ